MEAGLRWGTLVKAMWRIKSMPDFRPRQPQTNIRKCGTQPAYKSMPAVVKMPCLLLCSTASRMCFRRQSRKGKIMTKELANEHKSFWSTLWTRLESVAVRNVSRWNDAGISESGAHGKTSHSQYGIQTAGRAGVYRGRDAAWSGKSSSRSISAGPKTKPSHWMIFILLPVRFCAPEERRNGAQVLIADGRTN
jgi:hypothetical protein